MSQDFDFDASVRLQNEVRDILHRGRINFKKSSKDRITVTYCEARLEALEIQWSTFNQMHRQIVGETDPSDLCKSKYVKEGIYEVTEEFYFDYKCELKEKLLSLRPARSSSNSNMPGNNVGDSKICSVRLPKISIPIFNGSYTDWPSFRDLFTSLIHKNEALDDVQKLHYLKSHLSGEADQLLRYIPITDNNYLICWEKLQSRYDNKKYLSNQVLNRLLGSKPLLIESASAIKGILDTMNECLSALQNLDIDINSWDIIVIHIIKQKLDSNTRRLWEAKASESDDLPKLDIFREFLNHRFRSLEFLDIKCKPKVLITNAKATVMHVSNIAKSNGDNTNKNVSCPFCKENHKISKCQKFGNEPYVTRHSFVQTNGMCFNCLGTNHSVFACRLPVRCTICRRKHNLLLHPDQPEDNASASEPGDNNVVSNIATASDVEEDEEAELETTAANVHSCFSKVRSQVLLATALVTSKSNTGTEVTLRCLLDQGSQASFITESAVQTLGLKKVPNKIKVSGVGDGDNKTVTSTSAVFIKVQSVYDPNFVVKVKVHVLKKLTTFLPSRKVMYTKWPVLESIKLADPGFSEPNKIDLLLGAEVYGQILMDGLMKGPMGSPVAQNTKLGWILSGQVTEKGGEEVGFSSHNATIVSMHAHVNESDMLKQFWELEAEPSVVNGKRILTEEEKTCENLFEATTTRDSHGRYIVRLPFRSNDPKCQYGNLKEISAKCLFRLGKRLSNDSDLKKKYTEVMKEYEELGHMEVVPEKEQNTVNAVYLPHHAIVREDRTTTKVRVVMNASCAGTNGVSLNDDLLVGPKLQPDLRHLVMRWRQHPIVLIADVIKMYRQVKVAKEDTDFQRLLWFDDDGNMQHYRMLRVTFGTASAPYLAVRALQQLAYDEGEIFPAASERVLQDFYMDDLMTGCESVEEGLEIYREMNDLMRKGGFELQKWASNCEELLERVGEFKVEKDLKIGEEKLKEGVLKVLGLNWNNNKEQFQYKVQLPPVSMPITKRKVVSDISRLFDPLGWLAPVIIIAKVFIQKLWIAGLEWDQELPHHLMQEWLSFRSQLVLITGISFPRWIHSRRGQVVELHGFCDASNDAYAAVVYSRVIDDNGDVHISLIAAKTKVAPIKQVSIPRLELCGAVLVAKLLHEVSEVLNVPKDRVHGWTDSEVVLAWLSSHPSRWKTFIANRVSEVITLFDRSHWSHVRSKSNPADLASRGVKPSDLGDMKLWKEGPCWLLKNNINYSPPLIQEMYNTDLEEKTNKACHATTAEEEDPMFTRFSSLLRQVRVIAWCRRFVKITRSSGQLNFSKWLSCTELHEALIICTRQSQKHYFSSEIDSILRTGKVGKKSKLATLDPYIDDYELLRVGGRLRHSQLSEERKHPVLIPNNSHLSSLIVADAHHKTLHGGPQLMLNYIRLKYWLINCKNAVKAYIRKCVVCLRHSSGHNDPIMGQLPAARVTPSRPFQHSGVDYAGPIAVRTTKGRGQHATKGYICLFICMSTRAIHLEVVSDMTAEAFIAAFKRFVARRGHCSDLWSDNGTNFVGAEKDLKALFQAERSTVATDIVNWLANNDTTFHRIPPYSPNFGGLWEAGVKSTKHHLKRVIGTSTLTFEELTTALAQIEACLNSRPITQVSKDDISDPYPLTPGHFLVGEPLLLVPDKNYENSNIHSLKRWQFMQRMVQCFWRRWSQEYLTQFLQRYKWKSHIPEPKVGDVVLVKEDNLPPARWLYGIIVQKHTGLDQVTRVVSLRCKGVVIKRPVSKLCILPIKN